MSPLKVQAVDRAARWLVRAAAVAGVEVVVTIRPEHSGALSVTSEVRSARDADRDELGGFDG